MPAAHAKINVHLEVLARETTGYHQIETLFCLLDLADDVDVALGGDGIRLDVEGAELGPAETNLAFRAAAAFFETARRPASACIRIVKNIPAGAGLGGGSSDAATTLLALNALHEDVLDAAALREVGLAIGSDVPFFLSREPYALAWGRGDRLLPLPPPAATPLVLVVPHARVSTRAAYHALAVARGEHHTPLPRMLALDALRTFEGVATFAKNDFENVVFAAHIELREIKAGLVRAGAFHAMLTGTGSALFGMFPSEGSARKAAADIRASQPNAETIVTTTLGDARVTARGKTSNHEE